MAKGKLIPIVKFSKELPKLQKYLKTIKDKVYAIKAMEDGWRNPHPDTDQKHSLWILESESIGVHEGYCDDEGDYWIVADYDCCPTRPLLVKWKDHK